MSIQAKVTLGILLIALLPISVFGIVVFYGARAQLEEGVIDKFQAIADIQEARINELLQANLREIRLITSRTQLRISLDAYLREENEKELGRIQNIVDDASISLEGIHSISVIDPAGMIIVSSDIPLNNTLYHRAEILQDIKGAPALVEVFRDSDFVIRLRFVAPLVYEGRALGTVEVIKDAKQFLEVTESYTGLGTTGEIIIAQKNTVGDAVFLTPLRFDAGAALSRAVPKDDVAIPIIPAVLGHEGVFNTPETKDYRGVSIVAVTRYIDALDWGLVVKKDREEAFLPIDTLLKTFFTALLFGAVFILLLAYFFARKLTERIVALTHIAESFKEGVFEKKVVIKGHDEIAQLGTAFNVMADTIEKGYQTLEERVSERTQALEEKTREMEKANALMVDRELKMIEMKKIKNSL